MDSFEAVVAAILERQGYWVRPGFKVELTKEEKIEIGRPSSPRWELDIIAYKGNQNEVLVVECKSFLDSSGVRYSAFGITEGSNIDRYKLFNNETLRRVVFSRLAKQLTEAGSCRPSPTIRLCLAAGKIRNDAEREKLRRLFAEQGWHLWDKHWLHQALREMAGSGYDNQVAAVVAKLLLRPQDVETAV